MGKINIADIRNAMLCDGNMIYFSYNGQKCGADLEGTAPAFRFYVWYGSKSKDYASFDLMMNDKIFDGHSLLSLLDTVEIFFA